MQDSAAKFDAMVAAGAVSSPWWLQYFDHASHLFFILGGAVLLCIRIAVAWREWRRKAG